MASARLFFAELERSKFPSEVPVERLGLAVRNEGMDVLGGQPEVN